MTGGSTEPRMEGMGPAWLALSLLLPVVLGYGYGLLRLRRRGDAWPPTRTLGLAVGVMALAGALLWPLVDAMGFPQHVMQHLLLAMLAPLALAMGAPVTLALRTLRPRPRRGLLVLVHSLPVRVLSSAPLLILLEVGGMYAYYLTPLYGYAETHPWAHTLVHTHMFLAGCLFSWYVVGRDPVPGGRSTRARLLVLFVAAGCHDLLAKLMYAHLLPTGGGTPEQLRAGAQLMFYGGDVIDLLLAAALMTQWYARSGRQLRHARRRAAAVTAARHEHPPRQDDAIASR